MPTAAQEQNRELPLAKTVNCRLPRKQGIPIEEYGKMIYGDVGPLNFFVATVQVLCGCDLRDLRRILDL